MKARGLEALRKSDRRRLRKRDQKASEWVITKHGCPERLPGNATVMNFSSQVRSLRRLEREAGKRLEPLPEMKIKKRTDLCACPAMHEKMRKETSMFALFF